MWYRSLESSYYGKDIYLRSSVEDQVEATYTTFEVYRLITDTGRCSWLIYPLNIASTNFDQKLSNFRANKWLARIWLKHMRLCIQVKFWG